jgi:hypothetical protein
MRDDHFEIGRDRDGKDLKTSVSGRDRSGWDFLGIVSGFFGDFSIISNKIIHMHIKYKRIVSQLYQNQLD